MPVWYSANRSAALLPVRLGLVSDSTVIVAFSFTRLRACASAIVNVPFLLLGGFAEDRSSVPIDLNTLPSRNKRSSFMIRMRATGSSGGVAAAPQTKSHRSVLASGARCFPPLFQFAKASSRRARSLPPANRSRSFISPLPYCSTRLSAVVAYTSSSCGIGCNRAALVSLNTQASPHPFRAITIHCTKQSPRSLYHAIFVLPCIDQIVKGILSPRLNIIGSYSILWMQYRQFMLGTGKTNVPSACFIF